MKDKLMIWKCNKCGDHFKPCIYIDTSGSTNNTPVKCPLDLEEPSWSEEQYKPYENIVLKL